MLLLHQVLPHVHHEPHGFENAITKVADHHHSHGNDHHHHDEEEDDDFDFLGFLFGNHTHSIDVNTLPIVKKVINLKAGNKYFSLEEIAVLATYLSLCDEENKYKLGHAPPDFANSIYLYTSSLRGPPTLG